MSGGSLNYLYSRVEDAASDIRGYQPGNVLYIAFAAHLTKVAKALHDVEWVIDSDYGEDGADEAIKSVITPSMILEEAVKTAETIRDELTAAIDAAKKTIP